MQNDLYRWAEEVGMMFNAKKFELLRFWAHHDETPLFDYILDKSQIAEKLCVQDLDDK